MSRRPDNIRLKLSIAWTKWRHAVPHRLLTGCHVPLFLTLIVAALPIHAAGNILTEPKVVDSENWQEYLPKFFVSAPSTRLMIVEKKQRQDIELQIWLTDPMLVSSSDAQAQIRFEGGELEPIELRGFRRIEVTWIDETRIAVESWPGRCIEIHSVIDIVLRQTVKSEVKNHCGVETSGT